MTEDNCYTIETESGNITLSEEELKKLAAVGLDMRDKADMLNRLENTAKISEMSLEKLVDEVCSGKDGEVYSALLKKVSGDEKLADMLFNNLGGRAKCTGAVCNDISLQDEFEKIKGKYNLSSFERLPQAVKDLAVNENIPLEYALLRFAADEYIKRSKNDRLRAHNLKMGFVPAGDIDSDSAGTVLSMLRGVRG